MSDTCGLGPRSRSATPLNKLCRMLRNTLRSYPKAKLLHGRGGFGASLDASSMIYIRYNGRWTAEDLRDCLALFATWLVVDPSRIMDADDEISGGVSRMENERAYYSNGQVG